MILLQVALILLNAVFACAEIAVISMNDNKLNKMAEEIKKRDEVQAKIDGLKQVKEMVKNFSLY